MILGAYVVVHPTSKGRLPTKGNFCNNHTHVKNINAKKTMGTFIMKQVCDPTFATFTHLLKTMDIYIMKVAIYNL